MKFTVYELIWLGTIAYGGLIVFVGCLVDLIRRVELRMTARQKAFKIIGLAAVCVMMIGGFCLFNYLQVER